MSCLKEPVSKQDGRYGCHGSLSDRSLGIGSRQKILLVDDEDGLLDVTAAVLDDNGYDVVVASNAEEALDIFKEEKGRIDLLFSDINLPGLSGIQLAERLEAESPSIRILLMSGNPYMTDKVLNYKFMGKPYRFADMLRFVRDMLS